MRTPNFWNVAALLHTALHTSALIEWRREFDKVVYCHNCYFRSLWTVSQGELRVGLKVGFGITSLQIWTQLNSTQLKIITTLWSVDQIAQLITLSDSRVHKMKNNEHENVVQMWCWRMTQLIISQILADSVASRARVSSFHRMDWGPIKTDFCTTFPVLVFQLSNQDKLHLLCVGGWRMRCTSSSSSSYSFIYDVTERMP